MISIVLLSFVVFIKQSGDANKLMFTCFQTCTIPHCKEMRMLRVAIENVSMYYSNVSVLVRRKVSY